MSSSPGLVDELYPLALGQGKRIFPERAECQFQLTKVTPYPTGVVGLHYVRSP